MFNEQQMCSSCWTAKQYDKLQNKRQREKEQWKSRHRLLQYILPYVSPDSTHWKAQYNHRHPKSEWKQSTGAEPNIHIMHLLSGSSRQKVQNNEWSQNCLMNHGPGAMAVGLKWVTHSTVKMGPKALTFSSEGLKHTPVIKCLTRKNNKKSSCSSVLKYCHHKKLCAL